ncbi:MAG: peptide chain release factor-like protein [Elusimicrobia bacterium]|nr:peptide chain release factor-like protein [Elusimicrobiota bacterium]
MPGFKVTRKKETGLALKMRQLGIRESDLCEKFVRSGGAGGQKTNKTSSCVYIKHLPTGIEVKCQRERSQSINRFLARRNLACKIENMIMRRVSEEKKRISKIRRQKRKRSKRAKEKMLKDKMKQADKKKSRSYARAISLNDG